MKKREKTSKKQKQTGGGEKEEVKNNTSKLRRRGTGDAAARKELRAVPSSQLQVYAVPACFPGLRRKPTEMTEGSSARIFRRVQY